MRFLVSVIDDTTNSGTAAELVAIDAFNERLVTGGHWVLACGLAAPGASVVVDGRGETATFADGPLHESAEYVSGFWVIEASGLDEARDLAAQGSRACGRRVELRPLL